MDCCSVGEEQDWGQEMLQILHPQRDLLGSSTYDAAAAAVVAEAEMVVGKDQMDLLAVALLPIGQLAGEGCCLIEQMDPAFQMDLGLVLHILVVEIYMPLHRISY